MHVWLSVAWMKSPGSMICSRATWWQMPGETPFTALKLRTPVWAWNARWQLAQGLDLGAEGPHLGHPVGVDQVILEHRELRRGLDLVVDAVLVLQEEVHLRGGELVRVAAVDA